MFNSFDGDFRSRKSINLGGSSRSKQDAGALVRQAAAERQLRELERKRAASASAIQAFYRRRRMFRSICAQYRNTFDASMAKAATTTDVASVVSLTSLFLVFCNRRQDTARLGTLAKWLLQDDAKSGIALVLAPFSVDADRWKWLIIRLADAIRDVILAGCRHDTKTPDSPESTMSASVAGIAFLAKIFDDRSTKKSQTGQTTVSGQIDAARMSIIERGLFMTVREIVSKLDWEPNQTSSAWATQLSVLGLCSFRQAPNLRARAIELFVAQVMTLPFAVSRLRCSAPGALELALPLGAVSRCIATSPVNHHAFTPNHPLQKCPPSLALTENLMDLWQSRHALNARTSEDELAEYMSAIQHLLISLDSETITLLVSQTKQMPEDFGNETSRTSATNPSTTVQQDILSRIASRLSSSDHVAAISGACASPRHLSGALSLAATTFVLYPEKRSDIVNSLLFSSKPKLLQDLWTRFSQSDLWRRVLSPNGISFACESFEFSGDWPLMIVFSEMMCRQLQTIGDEELFNPQFFIDIQNLINLGAVVTRIALRLIQKSLSSALSPLSSVPPLTTSGQPALSIATSALSAEYAKDLLTRLAQLLHSRDSRKRFCPNGHWLVDPQLCTPQFLEMVANADLPMQRPQVQGVNRAAQALSILRDIPFVIPFETRVAILHYWIGKDRQSILPRFGFGHTPVVHATIHRGTVFEDGYTQLSGMGSALKGRVAITFVDKDGITEPGIDGGGVFKEFLTSCLKQALDSNYGLFQATEDQMLYPSSSAYATEDQQLKLMEFLGRIIGKALYEGVLIDVSMANFFLAKWLGKRSYLDDLPSLDPELYNGLMILKNYTGDVERDLSLTFSITESEFGATHTVELIPNGLHEPVTAKNRIRYIYLMANYKLNIKISQQCQAFFRGLSDLIDPVWLRMFNEQELQVVLSGTASPIDLDNMRKCTTYSGVYDDQHPTIQAFWEAVQEFDDDLRRRLVKFITSCSRPPLLGFSELQPPLCIRDAGNDENRLPTASTCINLLKLPIYTSQEQLGRKLRYAIMSESGFGLS